jgi:hypothetical protein
MFLGLDLANLRCGDVFEIAGPQKLSVAAENREYF